MSVEEDQIDGIPKTNPEEVEVEEERLSRALNDLCMMASSLMGMAMSSSRIEKKKMTVSDLALLLLGVSVTMMTCGWTTFFLGFMLMPWVLSLFFFLYVIAGFSTLFAFLVRRRRPPCFFPPFDSRCFRWFHNPKEASRTLLRGLCF